MNRLRRHARQAIAAGIVLLFVLSILGFIYRDRQGREGVRISTAGASGETAPLRPSEQAQEPSWNISRSSGAVSSVTVHVTFPPCRFDAVEEGIVVRMDGASFAGLPGEPDVPQAAQVIEGHAGYRARVRILGVEVGLVTQDVYVVPVPTRRNTVFTPSSFESRLVREPDVALYESDAFWPEVPVSVDEAWMGPNKLVKVAVYPVQFNAVQRSLRQLASVSARIEFRKRDKEESKRGPR